MRWRETGASPFGLCFRGDSRSLAFETWSYEAAYLPRGAGIPIVTPRGFHAEPLVFISGPSGAVAGPSPEHCGAGRTLTGVQVQRAASTTPLSEGVRWFAQRCLFSLQDGPSHSLELEWDHARLGKSHDFSPDIPIVLRW